MIFKSLILLIAPCVFAELTVEEPIAIKQPMTLEKHGEVRIDDYFWLKNKSSKDVLSYLKKENDYTREILKGTEKLQKKLFFEMKSKVVEKESSAPFKNGNFEYFTKVVPNQQHVQYCRRNLNKKNEVVLIDVNKIARGFDYTQVSFPKFYKDENLFGYAIDQKGDRLYELHFKDLKNNKIQKQFIKSFSGDYEWAEDNRVLFYSTMDPITLRTDKVYRFDFDKNKSELIYTENDEKFEVSIHKNLAKKYIYITSSSTLSSEVRYIDSEKPYSEMKVFQERIPNLLYFVYEDLERFYILTNDLAENFKVMLTEFNTTKKENWSEFIPHRKSTLVEGLLLFEKHLVLQEREKGLTQVQVIDKINKKSEYISFADSAYTVSPSTNMEYNSSFFRYDFESMNRAYSIYDYEFSSKKSSLVKQKEVPSYLPDHYASERVWAKSHDETLIPISLVYKKTTIRNQTAPLLAYAYGAYGMSSDPYFSSSRLSLLDRGFVFAIIHVRGGSELGRSWYEDGKFFKKKNTFLDFISGVKYLIQEKYVDKNKVFANGGSAGGLLMGAVLNMQPELFSGVIADVPFVDVVTTMLDSTLPLTTGEYEEWGNPNEKNFYEYMKSYSPYDNVGSKNYPHILVTTGFNDTQVAYWEPTKWVAKLRENRTDKSKMLLLKVEMGVGHGGKNGRYDYLKEEAFSYAFILKALGIYQ
jgi:oligopeptidase B